LTDGFQLIVGGHGVAIPRSVERVLAYLALTERSVSRAKLAETLWFDIPEQRATNCLRTVLWRLSRTCDHLVSANRSRVWLSSQVKVDLAELSDLAERLIRDPTGDDLHSVSLLVEHADLLPDWDDRWVVADRERFRMLRLAALEHAASALIERRCLGDALIAALAAASSEPLRESCRRLVVEAHVRKGNVAEALRTYDEYRTVLWHELHLEPSRLMRQLVSPLTRDP
jgi:DNA-binding SARP family transcriptional activator